MTPVCQTQYARARQMLLEWNAYLQAKPKALPDQASRDTLPALGKLTDFYNIQAAKTGDKGLWHEALAAFALQRDTRVAGMTRSELYRRGWAAKLRQGYEQFTGPFLHERVVDRKAVSDKPLPLIANQTLDVLRTNYPEK